MVLSSSVRFGAWLERRLEWAFTERYNNSFFCVYLLKLKTGRKGLFALFALCFELRLSIKIF